MGEKLFPLSRRHLLKTVAGGTGVVLSSALPFSALAEEDDDRRFQDAEPSPIPRGTPLLAPLSPEVFRVFLPGAGNEPSSISDFEGFVGLANVRGFATEINTHTGQRRELEWDADVRFMKGAFIGMCDHRLHFGTFGFM